MTDDNIIYIIDLDLARRRGEAAALQIREESLLKCDAILSKAINRMFDEENACCEEVRTTLVRGLKAIDNLIANAEDF